jgi:phage I-like protein
MEAQNEMLENRRMLNPLANRGESGQFELPPDGWYQVCPIGEFPHSAGVLQILDSTAVQAMAARFIADRQAGRLDLRIDYDHESYDLSKRSEAAGWITAMEARPTGLWANVRWTARGESDVRGGMYRFLSPAFLPEEVERLEGNRVRPRRLDSAGLTNSPNLRGMIPLSNRGDKPESEKGHNMKRAIEELGLAPESAEDAVVGAIQALKNRNAALLAAQVENDLERYKDRIKPESRGKWKAHLLANREQALELLSGLPEPAIMTATVSAGAAPLHTAANAAVAVANRTGAAATAGGAQPDSFEAAVKQEHVDGEPKSAAVRRAVAKWPALHAAWKNRGGGELVFG